MDGSAKIAYGSNSNGHSAAANEYWYQEHKPRPPPPAPPPFWTQYVPSSVAQYYALRTVSEKLVINGVLAMVVIALLCATMVLTLFQSSANSKVKMQLTSEQRKEYMDEVKKGRGHWNRQFQRQFCANDSKTGATVKDQASGSSPATEQVENPQHVTWAVLGNTPDTTGHPAPSAGAPQEEWDRYWDRNRKMKEWWDKKLQNHKPSSKLRKPYPWGGIVEKDGMLIDSAGNRAPVNPSSTPAPKPLPAPSTPDVTAPAHDTVRPATAPGTGSPTQHPPSATAQGSMPPPPSQTHPRVSPSSVGLPSTPPEPVQSPHGTA